MIYTQKVYCSTIFCCSSPLASADEKFGMWMRNRVYRRTRPKWVRCVCRKMGMVSVRISGMGRMIRKRCGGSSCSRSGTSRVVWMMMVMMMMGSRCSRRIAPSRQVRGAIAVNEGIYGAGITWKSMRIAIDDRGRNTARKSWQIRTRSQHWIRKGWQSRA